MPMHCPHSESIGKSFESLTQKHWGSFEKKCQKKLEAQETISEPHIFWTKKTFAKKINQNTVDEFIFSGTYQVVSVVFSL